jgi:hypothetical protein
MSESVTEVMSLLEETVEESEASPEMLPCARQHSYRTPGT